ncbi:beta-glucosidase [Aspergillus clavatus NRRL 1]|uniref:Probable beta-glucosidase E n=1 Tax=Aspergillus clavatus (strain ATCC 1007 / CBS 513.65 / DSM 816 / NCTC 3887 / NRRL 1 / QM 1276 / 107) TaxID=344612 RepID=BGLE_ASPCL|nr:glycosyl hydrolase family 3 N terminal domain protein [Aspergillus clavatus NRRL 1]A1CMH6.1 RecName: Full=Probable beta-glucosidase E; AltName: Full=Beta-D-glucoside glucohydrolase E; AltName: Full=Cellobiase E; AltName: Full=Gentiobiase E [Aspergillus clavatus NRRL 1]EAW08763.1 glycosyl hydrolase family 3 N terminal domain protein [Aspergillus clavatus NRRL 1]
MPPPDSNPGSFRDHLKHDNKNNNSSTTSKGKQRYTPLHDSIPEEIASPRSASASSSFDLDPDLENQSRNDYKLRPLARSSSTNGGHNYSTAYIPVIRDEGDDVETYLDSITEAEQELLSLSKQYDFADDSDDFDSDDDAALRRKVQKQEQRRRRERLKAKVWTPVKYARIWRRTLVVVIVALALLVWGFLRFTAAQRQGPKVWPMLPSDSWFPSPKGGTLKHWEESYRKAQSLVRNMTLIEKVNITTGTGWQMGMCVGNTGPAELVKFPSLCLQDGPQGLRYADHVTAFPAGITTGSTWNRTLMRERGIAMGREARLKGVNVLLGPSIGPIGMMPAGGRNWEGFGSDPVLQGVAAAETIRGIQSNGVMATAKHFLMNEQEHFRQPFEWGISTALSSNVGDRALHEVFAWPFAESIRADVASVMCSYQMVNNSHACENSKLLNGILKDELGFQGFVQSDWLAQRSGINSALGGLDMSMPGDGLHWTDGKSLWGRELTRAVLNTSIPMERLNDMVTRIVAAWYQFEQDEWERPPPEGNGGPNFSSWTGGDVGWLHAGSNDGLYAVVNQYIDAQGTGPEAHSIIARKVAAEGTVLLKNVDHTLPLSRNASGPSGVMRVGIYGDDAGPAQGPNACPDRGCNQGTLATGWGSGTVDFPYLVSPLEALETAWKTEVEMTAFLRNAVMPADVADKDLCLVFANADSGEGFISAGGIHGDRNDLFLQKGGDTLIRTVASHCGEGQGKTVVVIHAVGPVVMESWIDLPGVHAVLLANLPGQESGNALMDVLFGDVDASGRLPYTIGKSLEEYGTEAQVLYEPNAPVPQVDLLDALFIDYRHFDQYNITPRFEFGFGLSYTTFKLKDLHVRSLQSKSRSPAARPAAAVSPPEYNTTLPDPALALFPPGFQPVYKYIYPYLPSLDGTAPANYSYYPKDYNQTQGPSPAGGGAGGNPALFQEMASVSVQVQNTGDRKGQEVVQVYVSFPSDEKVKIDFPERVLRNFTKVELEPGERREVQMTLSRKDLSYWSVREQNWVMPDGDFQIWVGRSSRDLPLQAKY